MVNITALAWKIIEAHGKRKGYLYENHKDKSKNGQVDLGQARASYGWGKAFKEARESLTEKPVVIKQEKLQPAAFQIKSTRIANSSSKSEKRSYKEVLLNYQKQLAILKKLKRELESLSG